MNLSNFIKGVQILRPYYKNDIGHLGAEHDQIYLYATDNPLPKEDVSRMRELGWSQPEQDDDDYDPENGWYCWV